MDCCDKQMRIVISITLIIMTFLCVFNNFCYADVEEINPISLDDVIISIGGNQLSRYDGGKTFYFELEPGYLYNIELTVNSDAGGLRVAYSNTLQTGVPLISSFSVNDNVYTTSINSNLVNFIYFDFGALYDLVYTDNLLSWNITRTPINAMSSAVTDLVGMLNPASIWETFEIAIPYIAVVVLASFGIYWVIHTIKEVSKGREKMN